MNTEAPSAPDGHTQRQEEAFAAFAQQEQEFFRWQSEKLALLEAELKRMGPRGVLGDVGCFTGLATQRFLKLGFEKAVGFDLSEQALALASRRGIETRRWNAGEQDCPARDGEFDLVLATDVIEHVVDTDRFLKELHRVLKPDGCLIVTTPNLAFWISRLRLLRGKPPWSYPGPSPSVCADLMVDRNHIRVTTRAEWQALFEARGFRVTKVLGWSLLHAKGNSLGMRLCRLVDAWMKRTPERAFGLLFVMTREGA